MKIKDKLQIILITYNRKKYVERTFNQLFAGDSPIKDYDILVLDNNSDDGTAEYVQKVMIERKNLKYHKNKYNLGLSGNIAKALETANKEYLWIICDDDLYDWNNWSEVESAINKGEELLCVARYILPNDKKDDPAYQLFQMTFLPASIFKTDLLNDTVMMNTFSNIYTLFPHLCPIISFLNRKKKIYSLGKAIVTRDIENDKYESYTRGAKNKELTSRVRTMSWIVGYANICTALENKKLKYRTLNVAINSSYIHGGFYNFIRFIKYSYKEKQNWMHIYDLYLNLPFQESVQVKIILFWLNIKHKIRFLGKFLYIKSENNYKVINILGKKFRFKNKQNY